MGIFDLFKKKEEKRIIYPTFSKGFHGDDFLIQFSSSLLKDCSHFVETGSAEATTLSFVSKNNPHLSLISCEADEVVYRHAIKQVEGLTNVDLRNQLSPEFVYKLTSENPAIVNGKVFFWLDAHGYGFKWPLLEEVDFILNKYPQSFIFIDDFKVPGQPQFGYDVYEEQECSLDYLEPALRKYNNLKIYFPKYSEKTSEYHPLRGWVLITQLSHPVLENLPEDIFEYTQGGK
ncbi:MAG: hypothetical protein DI538_05155 [Azospira oryzae]|jgi:hypothetical protein|nr:MAG: hypothetical protein DI538_05155 [Azospira oryzae]